MENDTITNKNIDSTIDKIIGDKMTAKSTIKVPTVKKDAVYTGPCKVCGHKINAGKIKDGKTTCPVCTTGN